MHIHHMCCHHLRGRLILVSSLLGSLPFAIRYTFNNSLRLQYLRMRAVSYSDGLAGKRGWESNCIGLAFNKTPFPIEMKKIWTMRWGKEQWMFVISSCLYRVWPISVICMLSITKVILGHWADCRFCHHQFCLSSLLRTISFEIFVSILSSEFSGISRVQSFSWQFFWHQMIVSTFMCCETKGCDAPWERWFILIQIILSWLSELQMFLRHSSHCLKPFINFGTGLRLNKLSISYEYGNVM